MIKLNRVFQAACKSSKQKHYRKFQAFCSMHCHQLHGITFTFQTQQVFIFSRVFLTLNETPQQLNQFKQIKMPFNDFTVKHLKQMHIIGDTSLISTKQQFTFNQFCALQNLIKKPAETPSLRQRIPFLKLMYKIRIPGRRLCKFINVRAKKSGQP